MMVEEVNGSEASKKDKKVEAAKPEQDGSSSPIFDDLFGSNDALSHVLSFCDFPSALRFSRSTTKAVRQSLYNRGDHFLWKEMFHRHHFSLPMIVTSATMPGGGGGETTTASSNTADYRRETQKRRKLAANLLMPRRRRISSISNKTKGVNKSSPQQPFNLANRCFSFVPVTPDGLLVEWDDDPPPVDWGCDSWILTSPSVGGEIVSLDPFHGTLAVYESCLDNAVASDEGMMEQAMLEAANLIDVKRQNPMFSGEDNDHVMSEEDIAGAVFDQRVYRNHNMSKYKKPPFQILFRLEEDIDIDACFPSDGEDETRRNGPPADIDVGYHGIDAKQILDENGQVVGCMVAVGRMFSKETRGGWFNGRQQRQEEVCTELHMWTRLNTDMMESNARNHHFGAHKICRFPAAFQTIDICSTHGRVFVSFDDPHRDATPRNNLVVVYPMLQYTSPPKGRKTELKKKAESCKVGTKYNQPLFVITCRAKVTSLAVDPTGATLLVGSASGSCEVWSIEADQNSSPVAKRKAIINIKSSIADAFNDEDSSNSNNSRSRHNDDVSGAGAAVAAMEEDDSQSETLEGRMRRTLLTIMNRPKIVSFHHPSHLPFSACGFVTLQHSQRDGSSLLLWRKNEKRNNNGTDSLYDIVSMINLPLSGVTRAPRVSYDGRRILIFGQDHIGLIILVYHVLSSNEDIDLFRDRTTEEASGGVYNLSYPPRARFANRIRHAALGNLQYYDSIHMTANDRFIVVNTKSGNLLSDSTSPYAEGLLVIDLQD